MAAVLDATGLRKFLRDKRDLNRLIEGYETEDPELSEAIDDAIDDYNSTPPKSSFTVDNFPSKARLKVGAALWVLKSVGLQMTRNHLTYTDGGVTVEINEKTGLYQSWIDRFERQWQNDKARMKLEQNLNKCWGGA